MTTFRAFVALLCGAALTACDYSKNAVQQIAGPTNGAFVKFFNFAAPPLSTVTSPGVNFYADNVKMTAVSSTSGTESSTGTNYGGAGGGGLYTEISAGQHTLTGRISAAGADKDRVVSTVTTTLANGRFYSYFQSGIYDTTTKTAEAFVIEDVLPATIRSDSAYVRFVHAVSNGATLTLYAQRDTTGSVEFAHGAAIDYKAGTAFIPIVPGPYTLRARLGTGTNLIVRTGVAFAAGRVYTITARGNVNVASTLALDNTANR